MIYKNVKRSSRVNIYTLFAGIPAYIYMLPIPILQNILFRPQSIWEQITSYSLSLLIFGISTGFAVADYLTKRYTPTLGYTYIQKGFPIRSRFMIPHERLQSVIIRRSPVTAIFSAVKIQLNTPAVKAKKGDAVFYLSSEKAKKLIGEIYADIGYIKRLYRAHNTKIFFMAAIWSNPVSGLLIIAPFIRNLGKIAGDSFSTELLESFDFSAYLIYIGIPPTTAIIAYFMLVCYAVSVIADFIRNGNFICTSYQNGILIKRGIFNRTFFLTNCKKLNAISINQSFAMLPTHLYSAYIHTVGSGKTKGDKSLMIAAERKDNVKQLLCQLLDGLDLNFEKIIRPVKKSLKSYILLPFLLLIGDIILSMIIQKTNILGSLTFSFMIFTIPILLIWCIFRILAFNKASLAFNGKFIYVRSYRRLTFTATLIPINKTQLCVKRKTVFQRISRTCNLRIYIFGEKRTYVEIKHIQEESAEEFLRKTAAAMQKYKGSRI